MSPDPSTYYYLRNVSTQQYLAFNPQSGSIVSAAYSPGNTFHQVSINIDTFYICALSPPWTENLTFQTNSGDFHLVRMLEMHNTSVLSIIVLLALADLGMSTFQQPVFLPGQFLKMLMVITRYRKSKCLLNFPYPLIAFGRVKDSTTSNDLSYISDIRGIIRIASAVCYASPSSTHLIQSFPSNHSGGLQFVRLGSETVVLASYLSKSSFPPSRSFDLLLFTKYFHSTISLPQPPVRINSVYC